MADVAEIQYFDVESYIHGSDTYKGITGVRIRKYIGTLTPVRKEGELYASGVERSGADQFPVEIDVESNSMETLFSLVDAAEGTVTFVARHAGASAKRQVTITSVSYESAGGSARRDAFGAFTAVGKSYGTVTEAAGS